jgi:predicted nucleic acid-binding protein
LTLRAEEIIAALDLHRVRYVVIGGLGAVLHGSPIVTQDADICPERAMENLDMLAAALRDLRARLRVDLLLDLPKGQDAVWEMFERRAIRLLALDQEDVPRIRELMAKYADRPMDLADAALVRVAERDGLDTIFTVDRKDFKVYRMHGRRRFRILGEPIDAPSRGRRQL